jgi:predicted RNase H-like nuclease (RuvC/YqgF family)
MSSLNAYIQQAELEPINIHHGFYAMKIQQITNDLVSTQTPEQIMNSLSKTLDRLRIYNQILDKQISEYEKNLKHITEEISIAREYSMVDSLVREQIEDLTRQQNECKRHLEMIVNIKTIVNAALEHLQPCLIPDQRHELLKQLKLRGL